MNQQSPNSHGQQSTPHPPLQDALSPKPLCLHSLRIASRHIEPLQLLGGQMWTERPLLAACSTALATESLMSLFLKVPVCARAACMLSRPSSPSEWVRAEPRGLSPRSRAWGTSGCTGLQPSFPGGAPLSTEGHQDTGAGAIFSPEASQPVSADESLPLK